MLAPETGERGPPAPERFTRGKNARIEQFTPGTPMDASPNSHFLNVKDVNGHIGTTNCFILFLVVWGSKRQYSCAWLFNLPSETQRTLDAICEHDM